MNRTSIYRPPLHPSNMGFTQRKVETKPVITHYLLVEGRTKMTWEFRFLLLRKYTLTILIISYTCTHEAHHHLYLHI